MVHGGNVDAAVGGDNAGLGHTSGQVASQEGGLVDGKAGAVQIVGCEVIDIDNAKRSDLGWLRQLRQWRHPAGSRRT